eukprot:2046046-Amphidinium_carterae.1
MKVPIFDLLVSPIFLVFYFWGVSGVLIVRTWQAVQLLTVVEESVENRPFWLSSVRVYVVAAMPSSANILEQNALVDEFLRMWGSKTPLRGSSTDVHHPLPDLNRLPMN